MNVVDESELPSQAVMVFSWSSKKWASLIAQLVKNPPAMQETPFNFWVGKIPWRKELLPIPVFCMENSMNRGAWLAVVYRITKSQTWLKQLSTSKKFAVLCY